VWVRWPGGRTTTAALAPGPRQILIREPERE